METVELSPSEICVHVTWNSRQEYIDGRAPELPGEKTNSTQLAASIDADGMIQPPGVTLREPPCEECGNSYRLLWGFRRLAAAAGASDEPILCMFRPDVDDCEAAVLNLSENLHRRDLKGYELAEALAAIKALDPDRPDAEIAQLVNLDRRHVSNMLRIHRKLAPEIWEQYKRWGTGLKVPIRALLDICTLPHDEQIVAYKAYLQKRAENHGKRGSQKRPGPKKLSRYLREADQRYSQRSDDYRKGFRHALRVALGDVQPQKKKGAN